MPDIVWMQPARIGGFGYRHHVFWDTDAFVVPAPGAEQDADALIAWCRAEMANYKCPRHIEFVDTLPLNASGKVLKYELRDRATASLP